jgi:IS30 family transposase
MIYYPDTGQTVYAANRKNCGPKYKYLTCEKFMAHVNYMFFEKGHSIDAICGVVAMNSLFPKEEMVCTKTLYNYIDIGLLGIKNIDLPLKVKRTTKPPRIRKHKKHLGTSIADRPSFINDRSEFGHWEIDTVIGCKKKSDSALLTITECMTRKEIIRKLPGKTAVSVQNALNKLPDEAGPHFSKVFKSITADNGSEFA